MTVLLNIRFKGFVAARLHVSSSNNPFFFSFSYPHALVETTQDGKRCKG